MAETHMDGAVQTAEPEAVAGTTDENAVTATDVHGTADDVQSPRPVDGVAADRAEIAGSARLPAWC